MTIPNRAETGIQFVSREDLQQATYQCATPFLLELTEGELCAERVVRLIPKKRMVVFGTWRGVPVVAKLFFDKRNRKRHAKADLDGVTLLDENKIPTPKIHFKGTSQDETVQVIVFARIQNAKNLHEEWLTRSSDEEMLVKLMRVMIELATQHVLGVVQHDLHLGNFLIQGKTIFSLDGGQVEQKEEKLDKKESIENVALFLSQLGAGYEVMQKELFLHYAKARGWLLKQDDLPDLFYHIKKWNELRWQRFEKKIFRNCTDYLKVKRFAWNGMLRREYEGDDMRAFLQNPDAVFARDDITMLKNGRSSTVIKVILDGKTLVIKRYNMKSMWHWIKRAFRVTRAKKSWRLALKLKLFHINTAKPVAFLEKSVVGVTGRSYYVTDYVAGVHAGNYFSEQKEIERDTLHVAKRVARMLKSLARVEITHGDLKCTNILIDQAGVPVLIDLDGAAEHMSLSGLHRAWKKELNRFMRNFDETPTIHSVFKSLLQESS